LKIIELYKVIFCSVSKKYKIIFRTLENDKQFTLYFESQYAKNIAMASENIMSISLSQYELFINLLDELKLKIDKIVFKENKSNGNGSMNCFLKIRNSNNEFMEMYSFIGDGIIIALKTFSNIYIQEKFLEKTSDVNNKEFFNDVDSNKIFNKEILNNKETTKEKVYRLKSALNESINNENYEAAAFIRDRIRELKKS
tara:strand:+ start:10059 stop:10652 length:594 start_codon:yes stop_codon:yes gene_type:complete